MPRFEIYLKVFFFPRVDGTFRLNDDIIPALRRQVDGFILESKVFEAVKRDEEEQSMIDQKWKLDYTLTKGAESPFEISDRIAELLKWIRLRAWDLGILEGHVEYEIVAIPQS